MVQPCFVQPQGEVNNHYFLAAFVLLALSARMCDLVILQIACFELNLCPICLQVCMLVLLPL